MRTGATAPTFGIPNVPACNGAAPGAAEVALGDTAPDDVALGDAAPDDVALGDAL